MRTRSGALAVALPLAAALLASACSSSSPPTRRRQPGGRIHVNRQDHGHRGRERVRRRHLAGWRQVRAGLVDHEQPEHRPARVRGQPGRRQGDHRRQADRAERRRLRRLGDHHRERRPGRRTPGHQRPAAARPAGQHPEPAPVVQAGHDAGGGQRDRGRPRADRPRARLLLQGQRRHVHRQPERVDQRHRGVQVRPPGHPGRDDRTGRRLPAPGGRDATT